MIRQNAYNKNCVKQINFTRALFAKSSMSSLLSNSKLTSLISNSVRLKKNQKCLKMGSTVSSTDRSRNLSSKELSLMREQIECKVKIMIKISNQLRLRAHMKDLTMNKQELYLTQKNYSWYVMKLKDVRVTKQTHLRRNCKRLMRR